MTRGSRRPAISAKGPAAHASAENAKRTTPTAQRRGNFLLLIFNPPFFAQTIYKPKISRNSFMI